MDNIKDDLVQSVAGCDLPEGDAIIKAVKKCRIVGKMPPGFVMPGDDQDGQEGTSWTIAVRFHRPYVLLGSNFFEKDRRQQFGTLIKECYVRSALGDFGETGREDNLVQKTLDQIDRCARCPTDPASDPRHSGYIPPGTTHDEDGNPLDPLEWGQY